MLIKNEIIVNLIINKERKCNITFTKEKKERKKNIYERFVFKNWLSFLSGGSLFMHISLYILCAVHFHNLLNNSSNQKSS